MSKSALTSRQINNMVRFLNATETNDFVETIARRRANHYCHRSESSYDRYVRLNQTNRHTVEFRIFASTNDKEQMLADIDFAHAIAEFAMSETFAINSAAFIAFVRANSSEYEHLVARLNRARARFRRFENLTNALNVVSHAANANSSRPNTNDVRLYVATHGMPSTRYERSRYIAWYLQTCNGRFVTTQGNILEGDELVRRAVERLRCVRGN